MPLVRLDVDYEHLRLVASIPPLSAEDGQSMAKAIPFELYDGEFDLMDELRNGRAIEVALPFQSWRRLLAMWERSYNYELYERSGLAPKPSRRSERSAFDSFVPSEAERMEFDCGGIQAAKARSVAAPHEVWVDVGTIELVSGKLRVCDPCYKDARSAGMIDAKPGQWRAQVLLRDDGADGFGNGMMPARLMVVHRSCASEMPPDASFLAGGQACSAGVDSGQCGFYDNAAYPTDAKEFEHKDGSVYKDICERVGGGEPDSNAMQAAVVLGGKGVASRTFLGDGSYSALTVKDDAGLAIAAVLVYDWNDPTLSLRRDEEEEEPADFEAARKARSAAVAAKKASAPASKAIKAALGSIPPEFLGVVERKVKSFYKQKAKGPGRKKAKR